MADGTDRAPESVTSGLTTFALLDAAPPRLRVDWIGWNSGFRGSGLVPGDEILAVSGVPLPQRPDSASLARLIGQSQESQAWLDAGALEGAPISLTVRRRRPPNGGRPGIGFEIREVAGQLRAQREYRDEQGKARLGPGGPPRLASDGFSSAWASWYERLVYVWERQLAGGVWGASADSRMALADHMALEERVQFAARTYPGPFSEALLADWTSLRDFLAGRSYRISPEDLAFREDEEKLRRAISACSRQAWEALLATHRDGVATLRGGRHYLGEELAAIAGQLVVLDATTPDDWLMDVGRPMAMWRHLGPCAAMNIDARELEPVWHAQIRFRATVAPTLGDQMAVLGRIRPEARMVAPAGARAEVALDIEPLGVLMGEGETLMFVDLTKQNGLFAGEELVKVAPPAPLPADASPEQVMEAAITALLRRDQATWLSLFSTWQVLREDGLAYLYPFWPYPEAHRDGDWTQSRRVMMEHCVAVRIAWMSEPARLPMAPLPDAPAVWQVELELDHVGSFDGEFRAFNKVGVHRRWLVTRVDQGPWRIMSHQGI